MALVSLAVEGHNWLFLVAYGVFESKSTDKVIS
jgi:hypothetical protein